MRRPVAALVVLLLGAGFVGSWWWVRTSPDGVEQFLVSRGVEASQADALVRALGGQTGSREEQPLVASGTIEGDEVAIVSELGARIVRLDVAEGEQVQAGQVLVELDASSLEAERARAEAAVVAAQANLEQVKSGTHPAEILAAEAQLQQAIAERDAAWTRWQDAEVLRTNPQEIEAQIVQAKAQLDLADAETSQAQARIGGAEVQRDKYRAQGSMEEKYLYRAYNYQVEAARTGLAAAQARKEGAAETLAALQALRDHPLALFSQVHLAEGQYRIAESAVAVAEANLAMLKAGPTPEQLQVASAQVARTLAAVVALQAKLDKMTLRTPIAGIVTSRSARSGEVALAGSTLLTVAGLDTVTLTVYIPTDELGRVFLGQKVPVQVDSFPDREFVGTVAYIAQEAEFTPKNVQTEKDRVNMVFAVKLQVPNPDLLLKPGMPADAILQGSGE